MRVAAFHLIVTTLVYLIGVPLLFPYVGGAVSGILVFPLLVIGWYAGVPAGFFYAFFIAVIADTLMLSYLDKVWHFDAIIRHEGTVGVLIITLLSGGAGYFRKLRERYLDEIEQRKSAQRELEAIHRKTEQVLATIPSAVFSVDLQKRITSWNKAAEAITGLSEASVLGMECRKIWNCPPCELNCGVLDISIKKPVLCREISIGLHDGRSIIIEKSINTLVDENGMVCGGVECFVDVSRRKKIEQEMVETANGFQTLFDRSGEGLFLLDPQRNLQFVEVNPAMCAITGYTRDEFEHLNYDRLYPEDEKEQLTDIRNQLLCGKTFADFEGVVSCKDGSVRFVIFGATPIDWHGKRIIYGAVRDISSLKKMQIALERKNNEIIALAHTISHDLRNPLTAVRGVIELHCLEADKNNKDEVSLNSLVLRQIDYMQSLLDDLMETARLESGSATIVKKQIALREIIVKTADLCSQQMQHKKGKVHIDAEAVSVFADERSLEKVFMNLLGNALTYSDPVRAPIVSIVAKYEGTSVVISVSDNGKGIPEDSLPVIFNKFSRGSNVADVKGTGLGLSIVKSIVEAHGGTVSVKSTLGAGSTFTLSLPGNEKNTP